jgi:transposase
LLIPQAQLAKLAHLKRWCTAALRSRIPAYRNLVRRIRKHFDAIVVAVRLGLSNSRLEGINAKIRLIQRRGYGHANLDNLTAMIYLCLGASPSLCRPIVVAPSISASRSMDAGIK